MKTEPRLNLDSRQELGVALARLTWPRLFVRLFALVTCLVALVGVGATAVAYQRVNRAEAAAQRQLGEISDTFLRVANTLRHAGDSASQAGGTVDAAKTSLDSAATATRSAANALDQAAAAINITIAGVQPFATVGTLFRDQAEQVRSLARQIDQTSTTLGANSGHLRAISADTVVMANDMTNVSQQLREFAGYGPGPSALLEITTGTRLILAWSVIVHLVLAGVGISLFLLTLEGRGRRVEGRG